MAIQVGIQDQTFAPWAQAWWRRTQALQCHALVLSSWVTLGKSLSFSAPLASLKVGYGYREDLMPERTESTQPQAIRKMIARNPQPVPFSRKLGPCLLLLAGCLAYNRHCQH